ncbi:MAG: hypothetical protein WA924_10655 [Burkholderiaceae bacterium]
MRARNLIQMAGLAFIAIQTGGCVLPIGPAKIIKLYDGPEVPEKQVVTIRLHDMNAKSTNVIEKHWFAGVKAIDGKSTDGYTTAVILPGKHKFLMYCTPTLRAIKRGEKEIEFDVIAGHKYYPWSRTHVTLTTSNGGIAEGFCTPYLSTNYPTQSLLP